MSAPLALLADVGGTNVRFALADLSGAHPLHADSVGGFEVANFPTMAAAALHYLEGFPDERAHIVTGVFAVAGRIDGDVAKITNSPWALARPAIQAELGLRRLRLVNDFAAQAMAISLLDPEDMAMIGHVQLQAANASSRTYAVIGPGTGLGVGALIVREGCTFALETEGGHVSFAPGNDEETHLLERMTERFGRVSNERFVCGSGLVNIHRALCEMAGEHAPEMQPQDVTAGAIAGDARCRHAVEVFCGVFGAIAGDLALTLGAWDGVFLTGGLVPKMLDVLQLSAFRRRFEAKGRFAEAMAAVPTMAVLHPHAGLLGAAAFARQDAQRP